MAYVSNVLTQSSTTGAAGYVLTLPPHVTDDIILVFVSCDGGGTLSATWGGNSTGGAQIGATQTSGTAISSAAFAAKATGTAATCTINMGTADAIHVHMVILKDCDTTTWVDASNAATAGGAATEFTTASITTTVTDCLLIYYCGLDHATTTPAQAHSRPGPTATMHFLDSSDNGGTTATTLAGGALGWYYQRAATGTPQPQWDISSSELYTSFVVGFRNKSPNGIIPPYVDDYTALGQQLMTGSWWASAATRNNQNFKATPLTYANVGVDGAGLATTFDAGASVVDAGLNPYSAAINSTPGSSATNGIGFELLFPTAEYDMTTGWIVGAFQTSTSKMALFNQGSIAQGGGYLVVGKAFNALVTTAASGTGATATITFAAQSIAIPVGATVVVAGVTPTGYNGTYVVTSSSTTTVSYANATTGAQTVAGTVTSNQYRTFQVMARDNQDGDGSQHSVFSVQPSQSTTKIGNSLGDVLPITKIDRILILNRGQNAAGAFYYCDFHFFKKVIVTGGTTAVPVDTQGVYDVGRYCRVPTVKKSGAAGLVAYVPLQIGGSDAVNFQIDAGALQFPRAYSTAKKEINYHGASGAIGISYAGKSGDVVKHTNSVVTSPSPYYWEINSAATSSATWDFTGLLIVGANVTLRNVMTFADMNFSGCPTLDFTGCALTGAAIKGVPASNDTLTSNGSTSLSGCTINVSTVTAGNQWCSVASPAIFSSCAFTGGGGHAIRITTPGSYNLVSNTFTGFGADGSTGAAILNDSGGAVTLTVTGAAVPTVKNGASASTTIVNNVTVTVTPIATGSEVRAYLVSDGSEVAGGTESSASTSYALTVPNGVAVDIVVLYKGKVPVRLNNKTFTVNQNLDPVQRADLNYANP